MVLKDMRANAEIGIIKIKGGGGAFHGYSCTQEYNMISNHNLWHAYIIKKKTVTKEET